MLVLAYGRSGQIVRCPHGDAAVPSGAVTYTVSDDSATAIETGTATKGALSTTLAAAAVVGDRSITLTSATGATIGDPIALTDSSGRVEVVDIDGINSTTIALSRRLQRDYANGSAVKSAAIYATLDLSTTATWPRGAYYVASFTCSTWTQARLVMLRIEETPLDNPITVADVETWLPTLSLLQDSDDGASVEAARSGAWKMISARMLASGVDPVVLRSDRQIAEAGGLLAAALFMLPRAGELAKELAGSPVGEGGIFASHWARVSSGVAWVDSSGDLKRTSGEMVRPSTTYVRRGR